MPPADHSFGKEHRLHGAKRIDRLFAEGRSFFAFPFRCVWTVASPPPERPCAPVQILISVGKRNHKRAVARNILKRRTREAYRLNRHRWDDLALPDGRVILLALIYTPKEILTYSAIEHGVVKALTDIHRRLETDRRRTVHPAD
jgi:ribonuclease P protein component